MEKIALNDISKKEYQNLIQTAQQIEVALGSAEYKVFKMKRQREQIDGDLKLWWDKVVGEYKLDQSKDYFVDNEGNINVVDRSKIPSQGAANVGTGQNEPNKEAEGSNPEGQEKETKTAKAEEVETKVGGTAQDLV